MARAYSNDLRGRVVEYVESGGKKSDAARLFQVGYDTVYRWLRLKKETGQCRAKPMGGKRFEKVSEAGLMKAVEASPDRTLEEYANDFNVTAPAIFKRLKRLNITRKKNRTVQGKK